MNILEILWVILNILGVFYSIKAVRNDSEGAEVVVIFTVFSIIIMLGYFSEALTTPLW